MDETKRFSVSRSIAAPIERVFALLADPDRHPDLDASGTVRASLTHTVLTEVGDVFSMAMRADDFGEYQTDNVVTTYERDKAIGWTPGPRGGEPTGHSFRYDLESQGDDETLVTQTYDWSGVTDPQVLALLPRLSREHLATTLDRLAAILE
jgi:uncharacterized protein YndB with AHSA1/START domain